MSQMHLWAKVKESDFLRHNGVFFVGSMVVAVLNYLYYPVLGRLLPTTQFGEVQTLVSLFLQINIFLAVLTNVAVHVVANETSDDRRNRIIIELERVATLLSVVMALVGLAFVVPIMHFLQFNDGLPFGVLALALIVSSPLALQGAYLRGRSAFGKQSSNSILGSLIKLLASVGFVVIGFGTAGAIGGLVAGQLAALVMARHQSHALGLTKPKGLGWSWPDLSVLKPELPYAGLVLVISLVTTFLYSVDVIVVKHYFDAHTAGLYAGISTITRIIYFLTGSVSVVLLSSVKRSASVSHNRGLLMRSLILHTALGGGALLVFCLFPRFIIELLIGNKYLEYSSMLPSLSIALFVIATVNLIFSYDLALRRTSSAVVAGVGAVITTIAVVLHHASPNAVVEAIFASGVLVLALRLLDSVRRRFVRLPSH